MSNPEAPQRGLAGAFSGSAEFAQTIRDALERAANEGWPLMVWSDPDFEDWPLGERLVVESLQAWARSGRQLILLAHRYDAMVRYKPRFVSWRKTWDHIIECRVCKNLDAGEVPSALWSSHWALRRLDVERIKGQAGLEPASRVMLKELLDECRRQSAPGFPASVLGL